MPTTGVVDSGVDALMATDVTDGSGNAATAKANAVASVQSGYGNTTPLQISEMIEACLA